MGLYRCYFFNNDDYVLKVETADHPNDNTALDWCLLLWRAYPQYRAIEVWTEDRLVTRQGGERVKK
ncbi:MAG TPA: hypothetical protein VGB82_14130 [Alphaproteobacteria bacterium]